MSSIDIKNITNIRFMPSSRIKIFGDIAGTSEIQYLVNYEHENTNNDSYNKFKNDIYLGLPSIQVYDKLIQGGGWSDSEIDQDTGLWKGSYVGYGVTYHILLKIEGWSDFTYYKRVIANDLNKYVSVNNAGQAFYMVKLSDLIPSIIKGARYDFKCYAQFNNGVKILNTRPLSTIDENGNEILDDSTDVETVLGFRISNPKYPYVKSAKIEDSIINLYINPAFENSPNINSNGRSTEVYEVIAVPSNITDFSQSSIENYTTQLMGGDRTRRFITRTNESLLSASINVTYEDDDPSSGNFIRGKKLFEYGTNEIYIGVNLVQTIPSVTDSENQSMYIYDIEPSSERGFVWFKFKIDNNIEYKSYYFKPDYYTLSNPEYIYSSSNLLNLHYYDAVATDNSKIKFDFSDCFTYVGTFNFELKLTWINNTFTSTSPVFEINLSEYKNRLIYNVELYGTINVKAANNTDLIFSNSIKFSSKKLYLFVNQNFHDMQKYGYKFSKCINNTSDFYLTYRSNLGVKTAYSDNDVAYRENIYLRENLEVTLTKGDKTYTYDGSSESNFIYIPDIRIDEGNNVFNVTIEDKTLGKTVCTMTASINTNDVETKVPVVSINRDTRCVAINANASDADSTLYVNGDIVVNGSIYTGSSDYLYANYTIGENIHIPVFLNNANTLNLSCSPDIKLPNENPEWSDAELYDIYPDIYICRPLCSGNGGSDISIHDLYFSYPGLYHVRYVNNKLLFCIDKYGNDVRDKYYASNQ